MDPATAIGLVAGVIDITSKVAEYLKDVKDASKEQQALAHETAISLDLLSRIQNRAQTADMTDPWFARLGSLSSQDGSLMLLEKTMGDLARKLKPVSGFRKFEKVLRWPFDKAEVANALARIERLKTNIQMALAEDTQYIIGAFFDLD